MPVHAVVGTQWGDEGKGRMVDLFATSADAVVRFQGGANAGHTIVNDQGKFVLHLLPSGMLSEHVLNVLGPGVVIDPVALAGEYSEIRKTAKQCGTLLISNRAHVVLPIYRRIEDALDSAAGMPKFGSTRRGIAQAYEFKAAKFGLQMADLIGGKEFLRQRLQLAVEYANIILRGLGQPEETIESSMEYLTPVIEELRPLIGDTLAVVRKYLKEGKTILLEGQLGTMRDLDWGMYPYTTSSNPIAGYACVGGGIPPAEIKTIFGVAKAYSSSIGAGPFVTELADIELTERIRKEGNEFGATSGRPRRIGWFDIVATRYGLEVQAATSVCITLLDVLSCVDTISVCTEYSLDGDRIASVPTFQLLSKSKPVLREFPGWRKPIGHVRTLQELPREARRYLDFIEEAVGVPISHVSVGPAREQIIYTAR